MKVIEAKYIDSSKKKIDFVLEDERYGCMPFGYDPDINDSSKATELVKEWLKKNKNKVKKAK